jgi:4a-hydroxytetrahydrobiopterin dehydratase
MADLAKMKCVACSPDSPHATKQEIKQWLPQIPEWGVLKGDGEPQLKRMYKFKDFAQALAFTNRVGELAEEHDHHPALLTEYGKVTVR